MQIPIPLLTPVDTIPPPMPVHQDAYISDVVVVVDTDDSRSFDEVLAKCEQTGLLVREVRKDECVIEGTIDSMKLMILDKLAGVDYVRSVFTYVADFPPGDARDRDGVHRESPQD